MATLLPRARPMPSTSPTIHKPATQVPRNPRRTEPSTLSLSQPLIEVRPDWDRAAELGMSTADIGFTVAALTDGAGRYVRRTGTETVWIITEFLAEKMVAFPAEPAAP